MLDALEWSGCLLSLLGALLLATNSRWSRYGWLAYLPANLAMIGLAIGLDRRGLLIQQIGFLTTTLVGLYRAGLVPQGLTRGRAAPGGR